MYTQLFKTITALSLLLVLSGCNNEKPVEKALIAAAAPPLKLETFALQKQTLTSALLLPGELSGFTVVELYAKVSSYVKSLKVDIGSNVREGQLLVELEAPEISSQIAAALSRLHAQEAISTASNGTYQRLLETSKVEGTVSKNDLDVALSKKNADYAQLEAAQAGYKEFQIMQSYLQIKAPFSGKVTARNVNVGAYVGQGAQAPLLTVQDQKKLRLAVSVPESYAGYLKVGDELVFKVAALQGKIFKAKIGRKAGALDLKLRSERVELDVPNPSGSLLPGMIAEVILSLKSKEGTLAVPKSAIISTSEGVFVIKVVDKKAQRVAVDLGLEADGNVEVFSSLLQENDTLLMKASEEIRDGAVVE